MRELTVRIRFTKHCLGNAKERFRGRFLLPRNPHGQVIFLSSWHRANMRFASRLLGRHQDEVGKILWDIAVDGCTGRPGGWFRRYYPSGAGNRWRYAVHEALLPGQVVGIHCVVPAVVTDEDLWRLMSLAGRYRGLSPWQPGEYGFFDVESIRTRHLPLDVPPDGNSSEVEKQRGPGPLPADQATLLR
jgi:hypothetical protein